MIRVVEHGQIIIFYEGAQPDMYPTTTLRQKWVNLKAFVKEFSIFFVECKKRNLFYLSNSLEFMDVLRLALGANVAQGAAKLPAINMEDPKNVKQYYSNESLCRNFEIPRKSMKIICEDVL